MDREEIFYVGRSISSAFVLQCMKCIQWTHIEEYYIALIHTAVGTYGPQDC